MSSRAANHVSVYPVEDTRGFFFVSQPFSDPFQIGVGGFFRL